MSLTTTDQVLSGVGLILVLAIGSKCWRAACERLRRVLTWEGSLIDPVGGILGAVVYAAVAAGAHKGLAYQLGEFLITVGIGLAGAVIVIALLWLLLRKLRLGEVLGTSAQLACMVGVAAACEDAGLLAVANMDRPLNWRALPTAGLPARRRLLSHGVVASYTGREILFGTSLTGHHIGHRYAAGARIFSRPADSGIPAGSDLLFLVRANGCSRRSPRRPPPLEAGDTMMSWNS